MVFDILAVSGRAQDTGPRLPVPELETIRVQEAVD